MTWLFVPSWSVAGGPAGWYGYRRWVQIGPLIILYGDTREPLE